MQKHFFIVFLLCIATGYGQDEGERIVFTSANPFSFYHVITDLDRQIPQEVYGVLRFPEGVERKNLPLVVGVAGSMAWASHHYEYMEMYRKQGLATFELKSFASREVTSTVGTQVEVTTATMILDAYRALEALATDERLDINKAAITGWSLGGGVALYSAWQPLKDAISSNLGFAAHLSIYPPCIIDMDLVDFTDAAIHILAGELDDWVPADACVDLISEMQASGADAGITVYPGAYHSFDRTTVPRRVEDGYVLTDCMFRMRKDGAILMNFLDIPMTTPLRQKIGLASCAGRGPTYGGNPAAREAAFEFAGGFMAKHLLK